MKSIIDNNGLSIQELITIVIPGGLLCFILICTGSDPDIGPNNEFSYSLLESTGWISGFLLFASAYFVGYVIYVVRSPLGHRYDMINLWVLGLKKVDQATDEKLGFIDPIMIINLLWRFLFPNIKDTHNPTVKVASMKSKAVGFEYTHFERVQEEGKDIVVSKTKHYHLTYAYQGAFWRLRVEAPVLLEEVQRYYATAKLYSSLTVVIIIGGIVWGIEGNPINFFAWMIVAGIISFFVFLNRWRKANHVVYKNLIVCGRDK